MPIMTSQTVVCFPNPGSCLIWSGEALTFPGQTSEGGIKSLKSHKIIWADNLSRLEENGSD